MNFLKQHSYRISLAKKHTIQHIEKRAREKEEGMSWELKAKNTEVVFPKYIIQKSKFMLKI